MKETTMFRIGDKIRCKKECTDYSITSFEAKHPFEVIAVEKDGWITVKVHPEDLEKHETTLTTFSVLPKNFILVETSKPTKPIVGTKKDAGKPSITLIPKDAIWGMASAFTFGAKKYGRHNFRAGIDFSRLADAAQRHLTAYMEGENLDPESGLSHLDHAMASLAMLKFMEVHRKEHDDRYIVKKEEVVPEKYDHADDALYLTAKTIQERGR